MIQVVFETHSISEDNEREVASGWSHSRLSPRGRELATELGQRRGRDGIDAVFSSDLRRAAETAEIAFTESDVPILLDWRLREWDYGELNGRPLAEHPGRGARFLDEPYPGGESWRQAVTRVDGFLDDLPTRWTGKRILVIGHVATRWGLDHYLARVALAELVYIDFNWREGWEYILEPHTAGDLPRAFRTADLWLIHAADCRSRYS